MDKAADIIAIVLTKDANRGNGSAHFTIRRKDLDAKKLNKASAEVAYT